MKTVITNKTVWNIAYPIILGSLAQTLITLTDTAFLGRVSEIALGASAMAGIYYYVFSTLAWGFSIGIQIIVARFRARVMFRVPAIHVAIPHSTIFQ